VNQRRHVGTTARRAPENVARCHVSSPTGSQSEVRAVPIPACHVDHAIVKYRRWDRRLNRGFRMPQQLAGCRIVRVDALARVDDELVSVRAGNDERGAIRGARLPAVGLPAQLSRARFEGYER